MNPRPKVCHLLHDGSGQAGGGATFALSYFPAYLAEFETIAITGNDGDLADRLRALGIRTFTLVMDRPWRCALSWPGIYAILRRERPDVLVVHGQWGGFFGALAGRAAGLRTIIYYTHFPSFYTDWDFLRVLRNRLAESVTCRVATKIVCLGEAGRYQYLLRRLADESKLLYLPNCVDPAALTKTIDRVELLREMGLAADNTEPVAVSMGRLADQKRIDWILQAWALVEKQSERGRLAVVGGGPEANALRQLAAELGLRRCHFLGPQRDGYRYFCAADFGVMSSLFEALSLALIEAMLLGCPMIGTNVDGIAEAIVDGTTGLLVPPGDPPALAAAMLELLRDPARARRMGEAARRRAEGLYSAAKVMPRQLQLVRDLLARQTPAHRDRS
jgi:glycosyltransferase involved in cell wall biosynthesis